MAARKTEGGRLANLAEGHGKEENHDGIGDPLRQHGHSDGHAAHSVGKDLRQQRPEYRPDARGKEGEISQHENQHQYAMKGTAQHRGDN